MYGAFEVYKVRTPAGYPSPAGVRIFSALDESDMTLRYHPVFWVSMDWPPTLLISIST